MGQQQSNLSPEMLKTLLKRVDLNEEITVEDKKLEIRKPKLKSLGEGIDWLEGIEGIKDIEGMYVLEDKGDGVFALEDIPKGTVFLKNKHNVPNSEDICYKINDLAYHGSCDNYETDDNVRRYTNVGFIRQSDQMYDFFREGECNVYVYAIKDIKKGEQLSKYYGLQYWQKKEFWDRHCYSKFRETGQPKDLPTEYVFVDTIRSRIDVNYNMSVFAKKVEDKYYFLVGNGREYYRPGFFDDVDEQGRSKFIDITKDDFSPYRMNEVVYDGMKFDMYLNQIHQKQKENDNDNKNENENEISDALIERAIDNLSKKEVIEKIDKINRFNNI